MCALVRYGGGITQASGSIGGQTHARNRFGNYIRARTKPVNPNSVGQQKIRVIIADLAEQWSGVLTDGNRAAWAAYAAAVAMTNRLGEVIYLTGFNHFIRSNSLRAFAGNLGQINQGPATLSLPDTDPTFSVDATSDQTCDITYDDTMLWCDEDGAQLSIFAGQPQLATRNFFDGPWKYMCRVLGSSIAAPTSPLEGVATPWSPQAGQKMWFYARLQRADGRLTNKFYAPADIFAS